jgi:two-component system, NtrC family, sensor kinase
LELLPVLAIATDFDPSQISNSREINAAVINISGRQRMLCQQTALLSFRLVCAPNPEVQEKLRHQLLTSVDLMEKRHQGLLNGDKDLKLPGNPSEVVRAIYFEAPFYLDKQLRDYIGQVRALAAAAEENLTLNNPQLQHIENAASGELLAALDSLVSQYQKENEAEQLALDIAKAELYCQSCEATANAMAQAIQLQKALDELQQTQAKLIHAERISSLGQLVASLGHEINNPVSFIYGNLTYANNYVEDMVGLIQVYQEQYPQENLAIAGYMEEIDYEFLIQDLPQVLSSMTVGIDRIREIVRSLRNFSRTDESQMKQMNLHEGIDSTLLILQNRLRGKDKTAPIQVIKEYGDLPFVECFPGQLNQVFMNIISNAIDALQENSLSESNLISKSQYFVPTIRIQTELLPSDRVVVKITDNGAGIAEDVKAKLFDSFFTTKPLGKGTGLGLSICHQIVVEKHGGSLYCESTVGKGTQFCIEIPIWQNVCPNKQLAHVVPSHLNSFAAS